MQKTVTLNRHGRIAVLTINNPPVNAISPEVTDGIGAAFDAFEADRSFEALLVHCEGRTFVAGADIEAFNRPDFSARPFNSLLARVEKADRLVVAVLHGTALGGGLELALGCHYRVALPRTRVAFPEITLGVLPGGLGTQRVPRLAGAEFALDMMLSGRIVDVQTALKAGLIDDIVDGEPLRVGLDYVNALLDRKTLPRRSSEIDINVDATSLPPDFFADKRAEVMRTRQAYPAASAIVEAVEAAVTLPFAQGVAVEARLFEVCRLSPQSKALRHLFFAERQAGKIPGLPKDIALRPVRKVGIVGAGTMGGGIAMNFANAGITTFVVEAAQEALDRGLAKVRANYEASAAKGKLTAEQVEQRMALIHGTLDYGDLTECDLVIEAVFESLALKKQVCAKLGQICKPGAIIASNTSTLDVDALAEATGRPADVVGMHFFSPANVMRLLEVVRGAKTAPDVLATVMKLAGTIKKVAVVSGVCYGFIGNRMAEAYGREVDFLLMEGAIPAQIDAAIEFIGMAMGPCRMFDMAGIDVVAKVVIERASSGDLPPDPCYRAVVMKLYQQGHLGQKSGAGYYRYEGRKPVTNPEMDRICQALAEEHGIARRTDISNEEIVERLLYPMMNEAAVILEEGIAYRPGDIDVVWVAGYGFPDHQGGPVFMADTIGLPVIAERLAHYAKVRGDDFGYWSVSKLLSRFAGEGQRLSDWRPD